MMKILNVTEILKTLCHSGDQRFLIQRGPCHPGCLSEVSPLLQLTSSQPLSLINSQEAHLPLAFGLAGQGGIRPPAPLDFSQVLPLIRV